MSQVDSSSAAASSESSVVAKPKTDLDVRVYDFDKMTPVNQSVNADEHDSELLREENEALRFQDHEARKEKNHSVLRRYPCLHEFSLDDRNKSLQQYSMEIMKSLRNS